MESEEVAPETLGERMEYLLEGAVSRTLPRWPPDAFCICAAILQASGAYSSVVDDFPPHGIRSRRKERGTELKALASKWRQYSLSKRSLPRTLENWWKTIVQHAPQPLHEVSSCHHCTLALLNVMAAADEASHGLGYFGDRRAADAFESAAEYRLSQSINSDEGATLCKEVAPSKGRVLPKMHTPQNGLTIRSLSRNLAYCYSPDVRPEWLSAARENPLHCLNLLVVPWPFSISPNQFVSTRDEGVSDHPERNAYGLFSFKGSEGPSIGFVRDLIREAEKHVGAVHGIVFPELAMSSSEFDHLSQEFVNEDRFLIAGVGKAADGPLSCGTNEALIDVAVLWAEGDEGDDASGKVSLVQRKHHRWKLTKSQILQYGLAGGLHPEVDWWEHIEVSVRTLSFVTLRPWLTMSVLICEDLARPDPVGDVLRAVGPNLIIALLCDAPQLMGRWPGRYAGALADDPGSSVLTVTSLGASELSRAKSGSVNRGRNVALWRDAKNGATEIELPVGASALLLNLTVEYHQEGTADGRGESKSASYPVLSGVHPIVVREKRS